MRTLIFELSMPNVGSWNGKWSGAENYYAVTRSIPRTEPDKSKALQLVERSFHYSWGDGWGANVSVRQADSRDAAKARKRSKGFCGYEWMVDSLLKYGKIYADHQIPKGETV